MSRCWCKTRPLLCVNRGWRSSSSTDLSGLKTDSHPFSLIRWHTMSFFPTADMHTCPEHTHRYLDNGLFWEVTTNDVKYRKNESFHLIAEAIKTWEIFNRYGQMSPWEDGDHRRTRQSTFSNKNEHQKYSLFDWPFDCRTDFQCPFNYNKRQSMKIWGHIRIYISASRIKSYRLIYRSAYGPVD